jgi:hypothetical protein
MLNLLKNKFFEVFKSIAPLIILVCILQFTLVKAPGEMFIQFAVGSILIIAGLVLFFIGIDIGMLPMGRFIGAELPLKGSLLLILAVSFAIGFATTVAEPDVLVLAKQMDVISRGGISRDSVLYSVGIGVGLFVAVAMLRIVLGFRLVYLLTFAYLAIIGLSFFAPSSFIPFAYDAGSVTTGALTAPVVIALALGMSSVLAGRAKLSDGFGLLGLASIGPIIVILLMGLIIH